MKSYGGADTAPLVRCRLALAPDSDRAFRLQRDARRRGRRGDVGARLGLAHLGGDHRRWTRRWTSTSRRAMGPAPEQDRCGGDGPGAYLLILAGRRWRRPPSGRRDLPSVASPPSAEVLMSHFVARSARCSPLRRGCCRRQHVRCRVVTAGEDVHPRDARVRDRRPTSRTGRRLRRVRGD